MTVQVIKEGKVPVENPRRCTCHRCESVLEYKNLDIKSDGRNETYIECPICKEYLYDITYFSPYARSKAN